MNTNKIGEWNEYVITPEYILGMGKKFKIVFKSEFVDEINKYCEEHEGCGVIEQYEGMMYVSKNEGEKISENEKIVLLTECENGILQALLKKYIKNHKEKPGSIRKSALIVLLNKLVN